VKVLLPVLLLLFAQGAFADLYRWVDPETGSVKFSSYPPPWFGDPARERGAPKVEVIPPIRTAPAAEPRADVAPPPAAGAKAGTRPAAAPAPRPEAQRKSDDDD